MMFKCLEIWLSQGAPREVVRSHSSMHVDFLLKLLGPNSTIVIFLCGFAFFFLYFLPLVMEKVVLHQKIDLDQQTACGAPVGWSKYTTHYIKTPRGGELATLCPMPVDYLN